MGIENKYFKNRIKSSMLKIGSQTNKYTYKDTMFSVARKEQESRESYLSSLVLRSVYFLCASAIEK